MNTSKFVIATAVVLLSLLVLALPVTAIVKSAASDGRVDYCYIENRSHKDSAGIPTLQAWVLFGHRNWRSDNEIARVQDPRAALAIAELMGCPLGMPGGGNQLRRSE